MPVKRQGNARMVGGYRKTAHAHARLGTPEASVTSTVSVDLNKNCEIQGHGNDFSFGGGQKC